MLTLLRHRHYLHDEYNNPANLALGARSDLYGDDVRNIARKLRQSTVFYLSVLVDPPEGRALSARFLLLVVQRRAQDDPAIDRHHFKLQRKPFTVAVKPRGSDAGPETLVALVGDMPG